MLIKVDKSALKIYLEHSATCVNNDGKSGIKCNNNETKVNKLT